MATSPNNPFDDNEPGSSYGSSETSQAPPPKSKTLKYFLFGCLGVSFLGLLICCGGSVWMGSFVGNTLAVEAESKLGNSPVIQEQIGEIESVEVNWTATLENQSKNPERGGEFAFSISGSKGQGTVYINVDSEGDTLDIDPGRLVMEDGTSHPIEFGEAPMDEDFNPEELFDIGDAPTP